MKMHWTALVTLAAIAVYWWMLANIGKARKTFQIAAPVMDGPPAFLSVLRVQANTVEQMVVFFPALWMCAWFLGDLWAGAAGLAWVIGRIVYALGYYKSPDRREIGFVITEISLFALMAGTLAGLFLQC